MVTGAGLSEGVGWRGWVADGCALRAVRLSGGGCALRALDRAWL